MNLISLVIYAAIIVSLLIGAKKAPKGELLDDGLSLDAMTSLKGVMALFVLFHHISQKSTFEKTGVMQIFPQIGFLFVGVFFFCSGYGLYKSFQKKPDYFNGFLRRRVLPIVISYYVMICIYAIFYLIGGQRIMDVQFSLSEWICKLTGLTLINSQSWYVYVITIMYVSFYLLMKNEKTRKNAILYLFLITLAQGALFITINHFPWYIGESGWWKKPGAFANLPWWMRHCALWFEGEWWVNSTIGFVLGVFVCKYEKSLLEFLKSNYWAVFTIMLFALGLMSFAGFYSNWNISYWTEFGGNLGVAEKTFCYIIQSIQTIIFCLFIAVVMQKFYVKNRLYALLGKISLEFYLIQEIFLFSWGFLILQGRQPIFKPHNYNVILYFICVLSTVFAGAIIYRAINVFLTKKLKSK